MNTLRLDLNSLLQDRFISKLTETLLPSKYCTLGNYLSMPSREELLDKVVSANYTLVRHLPVSDLLIYRTSDIGTGYNRTVSPGYLYELVALGKVDTGTYIYLTWKHGNVYASVQVEDIDRKLLLTDETYVVVHRVTNEVYGIKVGKYTNPNYLCDKKHLDGVKTDLTRIRNLGGFNAIQITEDIYQGDDIP